MTLSSSLGASWTQLASTAVSTAVLYLTVIVLTRLAGPRSLAKMSSFDFAATVAIGSLVATSAVGSTPLESGMLGLALLYVGQFLVGLGRRRGLFGGLMDNRPLLLMAGPEVLQDALDQSRVSEQELWGKLRQHGVRRLEQVHAVILETTGDMSVFTAEGPFDERLLTGVRGAERLRTAA